MPQAKIPLHLNWVRSLWAVFKRYSPEPHGFSCDPCPGPPLISDKISIDISEKLFPTFQAHLATWPCVNKWTFLSKNQQPGSSEWRFWRFQVTTFSGVKRDIHFGNQKVTNGRSWNKNPSWSDRSFWAVSWLGICRSKSTSLQGDASIGTVSGSSWNL